MIKARYFGDIKQNNNSLKAVIEWEEPKIVLDLETEEGKKLCIDNNKTTLNLNKHIYNTTHLALECKPSFPTSQHLTTSMG